MNSSHYSSSFLITVIIYTLMGLLYLSFADDFLPIKKKKPEVIKISLITPVVPKKKIKKEKPKPTPKPKPKKKIVKKKKIKKKKIVKKKRVAKKKVTRKKVTRKKVAKKRVIKKRVIPPKPKPTIKEPIVEEIIYYTPPPIIREVIPEPITPEPIIEKPIMEEPVYYEPPPVVYSEVVPQETQYQEPPQPTIQAPVVKAPAPPSQQRYIINEPMPIQAPPAPPVKTTAVESDLSNEKRAFKRETRDIINSNKRYPTMAKRRHIQGTVHVIFDILGDGTITNIRTSGASTILQKSARKSVMQSSPLNIPTKLQSQFPMNNVSVNIDFQLQ